MEKKVYCKNCKWGRGGYSLDPNVQCIHKSCFKTIITAFKLKKERTSDYIEKNKDNNCKDYKRKMWKFWV